MVLEGLLQLVGILRERINLQSPVIRSEWQTRYALIDPLLRALGWDTADPTMVVPEDGSGNGRADYLLQADGKPCMVIEAKRLGASLRDAQRQALDYAMDASRQARYFAVTNGKEWMVHDTRKPVVEMLVASFDLMAGSLAEVSLKALALWCPGIAEGAVRAGRQIIDGSEETRRQDIVQSSSSSSPTVALPAAPISQMPFVASDVREWMLLSELNPPSSGKPPAPKEVMFSDGSVVTLGKWNKVMIEITGWLASNGYLNDGHCPIKGSDRGVRCIVSTVPVHSNGMSFHVERYIEGLYIELDYSGADLVKNAKTVINRVGQDSSQFKVCF